MTVWRVRAVALLVACGGFLVGAASAEAQVTASSIASPSDHSYYYIGQGALSGTVFTVTGRTTGSGDVDIDCYDAAGDIAKIATGVTVTDNSFSVPVSTSELNNAGMVDTCVLRAVDAGDTSDFPPGADSPFHGPTLAISGSSTSSDEYFYTMNWFAGRMVFNQADQGLDGALYEPTTFAQSATQSFEGFGKLDSPGTDGEGNQFYELTVDGTPAFTSDAANQSTPGWQAMAVAQTFDPASGEITIIEHEPLLLCTPSVSTCTKYVPSGVALDRTWEGLSDGQVADQADVFRSTDGAQHMLQVEEDDELGSAEGDGVSGGYAAFKFPGSTGWQDYGENAMVTLPIGPGTFYFKTDGTTPDAGDGTDPQGTVSYASAPSGPIDFTSSDELDGPSGGRVPEWLMPYTRMIPAGGQTVLRFSYAQSFSLSSAQALAGAALAQFAPALSITAPANGSTVSRSTVTVSGTAADSAGIQSLTVDGQSVTVGARGSWSVPLALTGGPNTINAVLIGDDGDSAQQQITVTYTPIPRLKLLGRPKATGKTVTFKVTCQGSTGAVCRGKAQVVTVERLLGEKLIAVSARAPRHHHKRVGLGTKRFTLAAGNSATFMIRLNGTTGRLLARFGHVPAALRVSLLNTQPPKVQSKKVTIRPKKHRRTAPPL